MRTHSWPTSVYILTCMLPFKRGRFWNYEITVKDLIQNIQILKGIIFTWNLSFLPEKKKSRQVGDMKKYHYSPRNENLNLLVRTIFLNLFLYSQLLNNNWKIYWSEQSFTGLRQEDRCSLWGLHDMWELFQSFLVTFKQLKKIKKTIHHINKWLRDYWYILTTVAYKAPSFLTS